jgi:hypothetical protein
MGEFMRFTLLILTSIFLAFSFSYSAFATDDASPISFGVEGGMNFANATTPSDISASSRTGFMGGVNVEVPITSVFSIAPELLYVQRGSSFVDSGGNSVTSRFDSLELPFLIKAKFGERLAPYVFAGPVGILNISDSVTGQAAGQSGSVSYNANTLDLAVDFGVGLDVGPIFGNLRYSMDLVDIDSTHTDWKNRGIQLLIGLKLG